MGVYIKSMKMPTNEYGRMTIIIYPNGSVVEYLGDIGRNLGTAVPVPPHGRLIEECKVLDIVSEWCPDDDGSVSKVGDLREMLDEIEALPTIIPAEEGE